MRRLACAAALLVLAACSPKQDDPPAATLDRVDVSAPAATLPQYGAAQLRATAVWSDGRTADVTEQAAWSSSADAVVRVSDTAGTKGLAVGIAPGPATVTASYSGVSGSASLTVEIRALVSVAVSPSPVSVARGREVQLTATATYEGGVTSDVTESATWTSDTPAVATVSDQTGKGVLHAAGEGTAIVTASLQGVSGAADVTVTPAVLDQIRIEVVTGLHLGETSSLVAKAVWSYGEEDVTAMAAWTIAPEGVLAATFAPGGASVRAMATGVATLTATYGGKSGSQAVGVTEGALSLLEVSPSQVTTTVGGKVPLTATGTYDGRTRVNVTEFVTWSGWNPLVATVSSAPGAPAVLTGIGVGTTAVSASYGGGPAAHVMVQVLAVEAAAIRIEPSPATVAPGHWVQLRAFARGASGAEIDVTLLSTWQLGATGVATIGSGGMLTGTALGTTTVSASFSGKTGTAAVVVEPAYPTALLVVPAEETATAAGVGAAGQLVARALYSDGSARDVTEASAWSSDAPATVSVSTAPGTKGAVQALAAGTARVSASFAGFSARVAFTITGRSVQWLVLSCPPAPIPPSATQRLTATAVYDDFTAEDVTALAAWSAAGTAATVDATGLATGVEAGASVVTATWGGVSGSTLVTVVGTSPTGLDFSLYSLTVPQGDFSWWSAYLLYPNGVRMPVDEGVELVSLDPAVADVFRVWNLEPVPRGLTPGTARIQARYAGLAAEQVLTVTAAQYVRVAAPAQIPLGATVRAAFETSSGAADLTDEASWSSSDSSVLTVTTGGRANENGWVTAAGPGTATITATYGAITASATIAVRARALTIALSPAVAEIPEYEGTFGSMGSQQFSAVATLADGTTLDVTGAADWWSDWDVASPDYLPGKINASNPGRTLVTASYGGAAGSALLTVVEAPPNTVTVNPQASTYRFPKGVTVKFTAMVRDWSGQYRYPTSGVTWTSSNPAVAAFSTDPAREGELTTTSAGGTTTIGATYLGVSDTTARAVVVEDLVSLAPATPAATVPIGGYTAVQLRATYAGGTFDVGPFAEWTIRDAAVASVLNGYVTGLTPGATVVTGALGGATADVPVTVTVPAVTGFGVSAASPSTLVVGSRVPISAGVQLSNGDAVDVTPLIGAWSSTNPAVAEVTGTPPAVDALAVGTTFVGASFAGRAGGVDVTVNGGPVGMLVFEPSVVSVPVGGADRTYLQPPQTYASSTHVGAEAVVTSSDPAIATAANGPNGVLVSGLAPGTAVVTATYRGHVVQALVNVYEAPGPLQVGAAIPFGADPRTIVHPGQRVAISARAAGPTGAIGLSPDPVYVTGATWTSSDPAIAKIVSPGLVEGVAPGVAQITATLAGSTSSAWVVVSGATLRGLARSDAALALPLGTDFALHVQAVWADGSASIDYAATWSSTDPAIAELVAGKVGVVHAKALGTAYVEASFGGATARIPVTVFAPP